MRLKINKNKQQYSSAFTIVELLVIIVIIGILASISLLSYSGIFRQASETSLKADLSNANKQLELFKAENEVYPDTIDCEQPNSSSNQCVQPGGNTEYVYVVDNEAKPPTYTLDATKGDITFRITNDSQPTLVASESGTNDNFVFSWGGVGDEEGRSIVQTSDGGFAVAGNTNGYGSGNDDAFIAKYNNEGMLSWSKTWGGADYDAAYSIIQTNDGGYAISGYTDSYGAGSQDVFIAKFNADGTLSWDKTWGGVADDYANSLIQTSDGGYAIAGCTNNYGAGNEDAFLTKYTADGTLSWSKTWGGSEDDCANSVTQTSDGGYAIAGDTASYGDINSDAFFAKFTSSGVLSWSKTWGGSSGNGEVAGSIIQTGDGGYAVAGWTKSFGFVYNSSFLAKFNSEGNLSWSKAILYEDGDNYSMSLIQTNDGGYAVAGQHWYYADLDAFLAKYDSSGDLSWSKAWGGEDSSWDVASTIIQTDDNGYAIVGMINDGDQFDALFAKYNSSGTISGCPTSMCKNLALSNTSVSATVTSPAASTTSVSATVTSPTANTTGPGVITRKIAPPVPFTNPTVSLGSNELRVLYPGDSNTACKEWSATGGNTIKSFYVTQSTEAGYDDFVVSADGTEVYRRSGDTTNRLVNISASPATTLEACMIADSSTQVGFGGEVTGVFY